MVKWHTTIFCLGQRDLLDSASIAKAKPPDFSFPQRLRTVTMSNQAEVTLRATHSHLLPLAPCKSEQASTSLQSYRQKPIEATRSKAIMSREGILPNGGAQTGNGDFHNPVHSPPKTPQWVVYKTLSTENLRMPSHLLFSRPIARLIRPLGPSARARAAGGRFFGHFGEQNRLLLLRR